MSEWAEGVGLSIRYIDWMYEYVPRLNTPFSHTRVQTERLFQQGGRWKKTQPPQFLSGGTLTSMLIYVHFFPAGGPCKGSHGRLRGSLATARTREEGGQVQTWWYGGGLLRAPSVAWRPWRGFSFTGDIFGKPGSRLSSAAMLVPPLCLHKIIALIHARAVMRG